MCLRKGAAAATCARENSQRRCRVDGRLDLFPQSGITQQASPAPHSLTCREKRAHAADKQLLKGWAGRQCRGAELEHANQAFPG